MRFHCSTFAGEAVAKDLPEVLVSASYEAGTFSFATTAALATSGEVDYPDDDDDYLDEHQDRWD